MARQMKTIVKNGEASNTPVVTKMEMQMDAAVERHPGRLGQTYLELGASDSTRKKCNEQANTKIKRTLRSRTQATKEMW